MGYWVPVNEEVYDGTAPVAWTDLDLSAWTAASQVVCFLSLVSDVNSDRVSFRTNGEVPTSAYGDSVDHGVMHVFTTADIAFGIIVVTDASGIIEWYSGGSDVTMHLEGYWVPSIAPTSIDAGYALPTAWGTDKDISAAVGSNRALAIIKQLRTAGFSSYTFAARPGDRTGDYLDSNGKNLGCTQGSNATINMFESIVVPTDDSGVIQYKCTSSQTHSLYLQAGEADAWTWVNTELVDDTPERNTWLDVDSGIGGEAIAFIECTHTADDAAVKELGFRRKGDTRNWYGGSYQMPRGTSQIVGLDGVTGIVAVPVDEDGYFQYYMYSASATTCNWEIRLLGYIPKEPPPDSTTTYDDVAATGRAQLVYTLEIHGIGVFGTDDYTPTETWFTDANYTAARFYPWLRYDIDTIKDEIDFIEGRLQVKKIKVEVADIGGGFTALLKGWRSWTHTWLSSTIDDDTSTIPVIDTTGFTPSTQGHIIIGQERAIYSTISTGAFRGVDRGELGTQAQEHYVSLTTQPPSQPVVTAGPHTIVGRRATLRCAVIDPATGTVGPGPSTVVYRGRIQKGIRAGSGTWMIPLEHISEGLKSKVGSNLPQSPILNHHYWYSGTSGTASSFIIYQDGSTPVDGGSYLVTIDGGTYAPSTLVSEITTQIIALGDDIDTFVSISHEGGIYTLYVSGSASRRTHIMVSEGSPLWALGFAVGTYSSDWSTTAQTFESDEPKLLTVDTYYAADPQIRVEDPTPFVSGQWVQIPKGPVGKILSISAQFVTINGATLDPTKGGYVGIEDEDDMVLKHVIAIGYPLGTTYFTLRTALQELLHLSPTQTQPEWWYPTLFTNDDFDWDELDDALESVPVPLNRWYSVITEGVEVWKHIGHVLGILGICPRITDDGKIGFIRISAPLLTTASAIELDDSIWSQVNAAEVEARLDDSPILNNVTLEHSYNYREDKWGTNIVVYWREGLESMFGSRSITYTCPGWITRPQIIEFDALQSMVIQQVIGTHFGIWGRESCTVGIPCTWTARQLKCGDQVYITHPTLPNTVDGEIGITSRLGLVIGRNLHQTPEGSDTDTLMVRIAPDINSGAIAPCALATAYTQSTATLTFSTADTPLYAGSGTDLDVFDDNNASTIPVKFFEYNVSTAPSEWTGTISTGGINTSSLTVVLTSDVFTTAFPSTGAWMVLPDWDNAASWQKAYAYISDNLPSLGAANDDYMEWII